MASFSLGRASAVLASGTMVSRVLGFALTIVSANTIGLNAIGANAFATANNLPNTIYTIIAGGALNAVLVPQIVRAGLHADGGKTYVNRLITLAFSLLLVATVIAFLLTPAIVNLLTWATPSDATRSLATAFAYWCIPQVFFYGLYTILGEVLNARGSFGPFTWAPVMNNIVAISGFLIFGALYGNDPNGERTAEFWSNGSIALLGGTATLGVALQAIVLVFFWRRVGLRYRPDFRIRGVGLGTAGNLALWSFAALLLTLIAGQIETSVLLPVADTEAASVNALQKSWLIFMLPHSVIAVSIATAYFTKMSGHAARGEMRELRGDISASIRTIAMILVFAAVALIVVARPFGRIFTPDYEQLTSMSSVIVAYLIALPLFSTLAIVQRAFYALGDAKTPFFFTLVQAVIVSIGDLSTLLLSPEFVGPVVAASTSVSIIVQSVLACVLLRRKLGGTGGRTVLIRFAQYVAAAVPSIALGFLILSVTGGTSAAAYEFDDRFVAIATMVGWMMLIGVPMAIVYFGALWLMRVPELRSFAAPVLRRLGR